MIIQLCWLAGFRQSAAATAKQANNSKSEDTNICSGDSMSARGSTVQKGMRSGFK